MLKSTDYDMRTEIQFFCRLIGSSIKESERDNDRIYDESIDLLATVFRLVLDNDLYKLRLDFKYDPSN